MTTAPPQSVRGSTDPLAHVGFAILLLGTSVSTRDTWYLEVAGAALALLLPIVSLVRISRSRGALTGKRPATVNLVLSAVVIGGIGVPNFLAGRQRGAECGLLREAGPPGSQLKALTEEVTRARGEGDPERTGAAFEALAQALDGVGADLAKLRPDLEQLGAEADGLREVWALYATSVRGLSTSTRAGDTVGTEAHVASLQASVRRLAEESAWLKAGCPRRP